MCTSKLTTLILIGLLAACGGPTQQPTIATPAVTFFPTATRPATATPMPTATIALTPSPTPRLTATPIIAVTPSRADELPAPLYFLAKDDAGIRQIWRLERDARTKRQITNEPTSVFAFDVSPTSGDVAYLVTGTLMIANKLGESSRSLLKSSSFEERKGWFWSSIGMRWKPDGTGFAIRMEDGTRFVTPAGDASLIQRDYTSGVAPGEPDFYAKAYYPYRWSPDGSMLILYVSLFENYIFALKPLSQPADAQPLTFSDNSDTKWIDCCETAWSRDSKQIYLSIFQFLGEVGGLWRNDIASRTTITLDVRYREPNAQALYTHISELSDGNLYYFAIDTDEVDYEKSGFVLMARMYRANPQTPTQKQALRADTYGIGNTLWAEDASGAVVIPVGDFRERYLQKLPTLWLRTDGSPAVDLGIDGTHLRWGLS